ncbi:hypothetical protein D3C78_928860 [compost metagenome]
MAGIVDAQALVQGVTVGVFQRRNGEMRALALCKPAGRADGANDACRLVGVLTAADHDGGIAACHVTGGKNATGAGASLEGLAADLCQ